MQTKNMIESSSLESSLALFEFGDVVVGADEEHEHVDNHGSADDDAVAGSGGNNGHDRNNGGRDCSGSCSDDKYKSYHDGIGNDREEKKHSLTPIRQRSDHSLSSKGTVNTAHTNTTNENTSATVFDDRHGESKESDKECESNSTYKNTSHLTQLSFS